jgi:hypothetical protein
MIDLLDEITEIPFSVFWDKWQELKPSICDRMKAEKEWFYMKESDRVNAFTALAKNHPLIQITSEPWQFLQHFQMPF